VFNYNGLHNGDSSDRLWLDKTSRATVRQRRRLTGFGQIWGKKGDATSVWMRRDRPAAPRVGERAAAVRVEKEFYHDEEETD